MSGSFWRAAFRAVGATAVLVTLVPATAWAASQVPPSGDLSAQAVISGPATPSQAAQRIPLRPRNSAQYAQQRAAADSSYRRWAAQHSAVFGPGLTIGPATITNLSKPGLTAAASGGATPPDTTGAIGPNFYLEFVNSRLGVYNRSTLGLSSSVAEDTFVHSSSTCDAQIKWDQVAGRWLYYSLDCGAPLGSEGFSFGFSKTSSPTPLPTTTTAGNWCGYHVATGTSLEDYGKLGNSNSQMIFGTNEFNDSTLNYLDSAIITFPKPPNATAVTTCPTESGHKFTTGVQFTPEPANIFNSSANGFVVAERDFSHLEMYTVVGTTPTLTDNGAVPVTAFATPASVPQPGSTDKLDSSDTRLTQANAAVDPGLKQMAVWTQHTVAGSGGGPSVVRWYELKAGVAAAPVQTGTVAVSGAFVFNGAISPTAQGNAAAVDYNVGSSTLKVTVRASDHLPGTAAGSMANETTLGTSTGINADFSCPSQDGGASNSCRWGDYAGASPDPICQGQVYGTNQLNGATSAGNASWGSQNFLLKARACPTASFTVTPTSPTHGSPATFDGSASSSPNGPIKKWGWKFGDGTSATTTVPTVSHTYATAGTKSATLTVTDSVGLTGTTSKKIVVG